MSVASKAGLLLAAGLTACLVAGAAEDDRVPGIVGEDVLAESGGLASGELTPFMHLVLSGDYVAGGTGLADRNEGRIVIEGIPDGAELIGAVLYWAIDDERARESHRKVTLGGVRLEGERIGIADTCRSRLQSFAYRVTLSRDVLDRVEYEPLVPLPEVPNGNGTYTVSGLPRADGALPLGASLVVVFEDDDLPVRDLVFIDGNMMPYVGPPPPFIHRTSLPISGFAASDAPLGHTTFIVGDGTRDAPDVGMYLSSRGQSRFPGGWSFNSDDGPYWDTDDLDLTGTIRAGETRGEAQIWVLGQRRPGGLWYFDCLNWVAQVFSVSSQHLPDPDPAGAFR